MYERILVPVDGSDTSDLGLREALSLAKLTGARLHLIHVVDELSFAMGADAFGTFGTEVLTSLRESGKKVLAAGQAQADAAGVPCDTALLDSFAGRVCDQVVAEAEKWPADLIVIGTHGRRGAERLLMGSDAERILRLAPVPVLLVRPHAPAAAKP